MRPILFVWHGVTVRSFPVMIYLASMAGSIVTLWIARTRGLALDRTAIAILLLLCLLLLGARLVYAGLHWSTFNRDWRHLFDRKHGGMAFSGGLLAMLVCSPLILHWLQLPFAPFWDSTALGMLAGLPLAKTGCLLHGCCGGRTTTSWFGLDLPDHHGVRRRRIPVQLLEITWSAALFLLLLQVDRSSVRPGLTFCLAVLGYAGPRFVFHALREEAGTAREFKARATLSVAIVLMAGCLVWLFR